VFSVFEEHPGNKTTVVSRLVVAPVYPEAETVLKLLWEYRRPELVASCRVNEILSRMGTRNLDKMTLKRNVLNSLSLSVKLKQLLML
jgi:hypothetical protein